jgi:hypothetical protein
MIDVRPKRHGKATMKMRASRIRLARRHYWCAAFAKVLNYLKFTLECLSGARGTERKDACDNRYWLQVNGDMSGMVEQWVLLELRRNARRPRPLQRRRGGKRPPRRENSLTNTPFELRAPQSNRRYLASRSLLTSPCGPTVTNTIITENVSSLG